MFPLSRRSMLGSAALGLGGIVATAMPATDAAAQDTTPAAGDAGFDTGDLPDFRYAMGEAPVKTYDGGTAQEATVREFPVSKGIAGVSMKLTAGGLRELHWHATAAEWAYILDGHCRTTVYDPQGRSEILDFGPGDVWYFPRGHGHSLQGIGPSGTQFILAFDNGYFSEFGTFSITDWVAHTPVEVLAKNFGVPADRFVGFPKKEVYISQGPVPPPLPAEPPFGSEDSPPLTHRFHLQAQRPTTQTANGNLRIVSEKEFPISSTMTGATMELKAGALRELHWHPNADEWQYYISGRASMTVFGSSGRARTMEFGPGDVGYVPKGYGHYIENTGSQDCQALLVFNSPIYEEIGISGWMASNPRLLLATNFEVPQSTFDGFPTGNVLIAGAKP